MPQTQTVAARGGVDGRTAQAQILEMYPFLRLAHSLNRARKMPPLGVGEVHVSQHIIRPSDIDMFVELNNGRTLTLFDLGRMALFMRIGATRVLREQKWAGAVAGASVRYRRRVRVFDRIEMRSRILGWDDRFVYSEQGLFRKGDCTGHVLIRMAVTSKNGMVPMTEMAHHMNMSPESPPLPDWVRAWIDAEDMRPWPPMDGTDGLG